MQQEITSYLRRFAAIVALTIVYTLTIVLASVGRFIVRPGKKRHGRVIINGTFHNPNWFYAHIEAITRSDYGEVILVSDVPLVDLPNLRNVCPPGWALKLFTRAGAKAIWTFAVGIRNPADCFMGYHIFPSAVTALVCARLLGAKAAYQVTSGPLELEGGGWHAENKLLVALQYHSSLIERLACAVTKRFDLVVVRGMEAADFVRNTGFDGALEVITGSVTTDASLMQETREIDVLLVGRLTEYKRPDRFIRVMKEVTESIPDCRAVLVGDGPDRQELVQQVADLGLTSNIEFLGQRSDVPEIQGRSKIFVLTSRWEGVSIAMLESMGLANVPIVSDVGDLRDFARNNETGFVVDEDDISGFAQRIVSVLTDAKLHGRLSRASRELVLQKADRAVVAKRWFDILERLKSGQ